MFDGKATTDGRGVCGAVAAEVPAFPSTVVFKTEQSAAPRNSGAALVVVHTAPGFAAAAVGRLINGLPLP